MPAHFKTPPHSHLFAFQNTFPNKSALEYVHLQLTMTKIATLSSLVLFLYLSSGGDIFVMVNGQKTWCVAKPSADQAALLANINYACSQVDCRIMQKGCPCNVPDNLVNHASIAMNLYYQSKGRNHWNCDFRNSGLIVITDPSYANCIMAS